MAGILNGILNKIKINNPTTEDQLPLAKLQETTYANGRVAGIESPVISLNQFLGDGTADTNTKEVQELWSYLNVFSSWHIDKFRWEMEGISTSWTIIEQWLFMHGELVVFKHMDELIVLPFEVKTFNKYGEAKEVVPKQPYSKNSDIKYEAVTIGEDAVSLKHNTAAVFNNSRSRGDVFKLWFKLMDVAYTRASIFSITKQALPRIMLGDDIADEVVTNMEVALRSTKATIKMDRSSLERILKGLEGGTNLLHLEVKIEEWWNNLKNFYNDGALTVGMKHDSNFQKSERKNVEETTTENMSTNSMIRTQLLLREIAVQEVNEIFNVKWTVIMNPEFKQDMIPQEEEESENKENGNIS